MSGRHGRTFKGKTDREWLKAWTGRVGRRGWSVGKGRTYLRGSGNDGIYGTEYKALIEAFQRDQGLHVDGLLGAAT